MKIMIDSGHNQVNVGARANGVYEEVYVLGVALELGKILENNGIQVLYTRKDGKPYGNATSNNADLNGRCKYANDNKVDYFISLHNNCFTDVNANGIETLVYSQNSKNAIKLAEKVQANLIKDTGMANRDIKYRSDLCVLRDTKMDAILVEMGFVSNVSDATKLKSNGYQKKLAESIANGIFEHLGMETVKDKMQSGSTMYRVVCGSFSDKANADKMVKELESKGYKPFLLTYKTE